MSFCYPLDENDFCAHSNKMAASSFAMLTYIVLH